MTNHLLVCVNSVDLDTTDHGKKTIATVELPGIQKGDIKIEVHDNSDDLWGGKDAEPQGGGCDDVATPLAILSSKPELELPSHR